MKYALIIGLSITLLSCSKDHFNEQVKIDALTIGTWKLAGYTTDYNKDGVYEEDTYAMLAGCEKDNYFTFQAGGNAIIDEGVTKCISTNPQTSTSSWSFMDSQTRLQFRGGNYAIEELTPASLKLKATVSYNVIFTINVKLAYIKQ